MTRRKPRYRRQGIDYLGLMSKELGDLRGVLTLAHELIQNADDAKDESGNLAAKRVSFDFKDDALVVSNDACFRQVDFKRMQDVAGGSKRSEDGDRTTGAFGVGFISVYQVTDRPEIRSAGQHWILRPEKNEDFRIEEYDDSSMTKDRGTIFDLPWALSDSLVREKLKVPTIGPDDIDFFVEELRVSLPRSLLFLQKVSRIDLYRNSTIVSQMEISREADAHLLTCNGKRWTYRIVEGYFREEAAILMDRYSSIDRNRSCRVQVAIPEVEPDGGLLFATLPTQQSAGLPFHINADFFPASDRRSIAFENEYDYRSEWNRAAIRAAAVTIPRNLDMMRETFQDRPARFWSIVEEIQRVNSEYREDHRRPFAEFWELLGPALRSAPVVCVTHGRRKEWLRPSDARIPTGRDEESAAKAFKYLGIHVVSPDHYASRNILTHVGVRTLSVSDIYEGLRARGFVDTSRPHPAEQEQQELLKMLWDGCYAVIRNSRQKSSRRSDKAAIERCVLAPGVDSHIWPCASAYQADDETQRIFANLIPSDATFLSVCDVPLLEAVCPKFTIKTAIEWLERVSKQRLQAAWTSGEFSPPEVLKWFDLHKLQLTSDLSDRLSQLPICPTSEHLQAIDGLFLPGGFRDPAGMAKLVDIAEVTGLLDFLRFLGIRELTFNDYARRFIPEVLAQGSRVPSNVKRELLTIMDSRLSDLTVDNELRSSLVATNIVECMDGGFRTPRGVYFLSQELEDLFGRRASFARVPAGNVFRRALYRWLGVSVSPRPSDVIAFIKDTIIQGPSRGARSSISKVVRALDSAISASSIGRKDAYSILRRLSWLPAEDDYSTWWKPNQLAATHSKHLFESQSRFIDIPRQYQSRKLLSYLGIKLSPEPYQVARHLLECVRRDREPPGGIYRWLDESAEPPQLSILRGRACLRAGGRYLRPNQVFWGLHPFGPHRFQLGADLARYQNLLASLDVKHAPDQDDAIEVLKEIGAATIEVSRRLTDEDESVVKRCWMIIADAFDEGRIGAGKIRRELNTTHCIPCSRSGDQRTLEKPTLVFFNDRPGYMGSFEVIKWNLIDRPEGVYRAMEAAGVKSISTMVRESIQEVRNPRKATGIRARLDDRVVLIGAIVESVVKRDVGREWKHSIKSLEFQACEAVIVLQELHVFGRYEQLSASVSGYLDAPEATIYFSIDDGVIPWSAIARELTQAIIPGEKAKAIAPTLMTVLEAGTRDDAINRLRDFDIPVPAELTANVVAGGVVENLEESRPHDESRQDDSVYDQSAWSVSSDEEQPGLVETTSLVDDIDTVHATNGDQAPPDTDEPVANVAQGHARVPFAKLFFGVQEWNPRSAPDSPAILSEGGPKTEESARTDTEESSSFGRQGSRVARLRIRWEPTKASEDLEIKFRNMTRSDYVERCQICGNTFKKRAGEDRQIFVIHMVKPSSDERTNHYGNLIGVCGWHYALMQYGEFEFLDPETKQPFTGWKRMRDYVLNVQEYDQKRDEADISYVGLPVRFWNVYEKWSGKADTVDEKIRYCIPHWKYLCELFKTSLLF